MKEAISRRLTFLMLAAAPVAHAGTKDDGPLTLMPAKPGAKAAPPLQAGVQTEELHDIHGPIALPDTPPYMAIGGIVLALLLVAAAIYFWLKKRVKPVSPPPPPWETALSDLAAAKPLQTAGQGLLYMEKASQVLRRYIESRFSIRSTRQTTREFLTGLNQDGNSPLEEFRPELQVCLEQADMAKFAHRLPDLDNMTHMELAVTDFVKKTEPIIPPSGGKS